MALVVFDLDDTLISGDSEGAWAQFILNKGIVKENDFDLHLKKFESDYRNDNFNADAYIKFLLKPLIGISEIEVKALAKEFSYQVIEEYKDSFTEKLLFKHSKDFCIIVSGTLDFLVSEISSLLGIKENIATLVEVKDGCYTGELIGRPNFGEQKVLRLKEWLKYESMIDTAGLFAYSDSIHDLPLLEFSDNPIAVSPDKKLREISIKRNWAILERK